MILNVEHIVGSHFDENVDESRAQLENSDVSDSYSLQERQL